MNYKKSQSHRQNSKYPTPQQKNEVWPSETKAQGTIIAGALGGVDTVMIVER